MRAYQFPDAKSGKLHWLCLISKIPQELGEVYESLPSIVPRVFKVKRREAKNTHIPCRSHDRVLWWRTSAFIVPYMLKLVIILS